MVCQRGDQPPVLRGVQEDGTSYHYSIKEEGVGYYILYYAYISDRSQLLCTENNPVLRCNNSML